MKDYEQRKAVNDESRTKAEHHQEVWSEEEIALLVECWNDAPLEEIAEALGRTVEACRQRFYEIGKARVQRVVKAKQEQRSAERRVNTWQGGFTSIEDMEKYYEQLNDK